MWKSIETAPQDGKRYIIAVEHIHKRSLTISHTAFVGPWFVSECFHALNIGRIFDGWLKIKEDAKVAGVADYTPRMVWMDCPAPMGSDSVVEHSWLSMDDLPPAETHLERQQNYVGLVWNTKSPRLPYWQPTFFNRSGRLREDGIRINSCLRGLEDLTPTFFLPMPELETTA